MGLVDAKDIFMAILNGLLQGGVLALIASGFSLVFGTMRVLNIAHGDFAMIAGILAIFLFSALGINPLLSIIIILPLLFVLGWMTHKVLLEKITLKVKNTLSFEMITILITFGLSIFLRDILKFLTGTESRVIPVYTDPIMIGSVSIQTTKLIALSIAILVTVFLFLFLKKTRMGQMIRAIGQDASLADVIGIPISKIRAIAFAIGVTLAGLSGVLMSMIFPINPEFGGNFFLITITITIIGGLGNMAGAFYGALFIGVIQSLSNMLINPQYTDAILFLMLILVLLVRPNGVFQTSKTRAG
jgi:branched-chain amino acid transport system permease protein